MLLRHKSKIKARKRFRKLGVWSYIHTLKPQIQNVEPRKERLGIKTIPCVFGEERRIKKL